MADIDKICRDFELAVWDLVSNPDDVEDKTLLKHTEGCSRCAGTYGRVKAIIDELKQVKLPHPSSDLPDKIRKRLPAISRLRPPAMMRFIKYATAASVLVVIFVLLLIFAPSQTLPEAVASAAKIHQDYLNGTAKVLMKVDSLDQLNDYCQNKLALPPQTIPKVASSCSIMCCCDCESACCCSPEHCEIMRFTNKGAWMILENNGKPLSLLLVKDFVKFPDWAKKTEGGMDCYIFKMAKVMVCAHAKNGVTYIWVSELGENDMHKIITEAMKN